MAPPSSRLLTPCLPCLPAPPARAGVCFTRNPATGDKVLYGEYLPNAQGEDVVAGIRTPLDVAHVSGGGGGRAGGLLGRAGAQPARPPRQVCLLPPESRPRALAPAWSAFCKHRACTDSVCAPPPPHPTPLQMADNFPAAYADLVANTTLLERHMRDMQAREGRRGLPPS